MSSRGPTTTSAATSAEYIRASDEYAVAFDLEIWKAQQQAKFRQQLRQAKEALEKKVLHELKMGHARKVEELEQRREELEQMAARVQAAGEALAKRADQFQTREQAFEARRVRVAEQHEAHLHRVEARAKQATETLTVQLEAARGELSEKDGIIRDIRGKLLAAENEYDGLLRKLSRGGDSQALTENSACGTSTEAETNSRVRALEAELQAARQTIESQQTQLAQQHAEMVRATRENAALSQALRKAEIRVDELVRKCARVQDDYYAREREHLQRERDQLEAQKREQKRDSRHRRLLAVAAPHMGSRTGSVPHCPTLQDARALAASNVLSATSAIGSATHGDDDGLHDMLQELRGDIENALRTTAGSVPHARSRLAPAYVVAEKPSAATTGTHQSPSAATPTAAPLAVAQGQTAPTNISLSAAALRGAYEVAVQTVSPTPSRVSDMNADHDEHGATVDTSVGDDVDVDDDSTYEHAHVESWVSDGAKSTGGLPPRPPTRTVNSSLHTHTDPTLPTATSSEPAKAHLALPPEDFVRAVGSLPGGDSSTTRIDMQTFVQQMKINRQKLLETGVYTETHPVIREMNEKIRIYEDFLSSQLT